MERQVTDVLRDLNLGEQSLETLAVMEGGTVRSLILPGTRALEAWTRFRDLSPATGCWPVLLPEWCPGLVAQLQGWRPADGVPADPRGVADRWLEEQRQEELQFQAQYGKRPADRPWPARGRPMRLHILHRSFFQRLCSPHWRIRLVLVPTVRCWEVPGWLALGDYNEMPLPHVNAALLHRWHEAFGAEIVATLGDRIECRVERPPGSRETALALAREFFLYSPEFGQEGYDDETQLAAALLVSQYWSFWWD